MKLKNSEAESIISEELLRICARKGRAVLAIDGMCASGKTTLAGHLEKALGATVFRMDDFFLPKEKRTAERLSAPGGNSETERFLSEVLLPLSDGKQIFYRKYDCKKCEYLTRVALEPKSIVIVEGSYSCHPKLFKYYDLTTFVYISKETQLERLKARGGDSCLDAFTKKWIPLEELYFESLKIKEKCDIVIENE